ncbi:MAG TPA: porin family protein [Gemmatimonadaceae bacterium]
MKRAFMSLAVVAALIGSAAQPAHAQSGLGIKGGATFSNVSSAGVMPGALQSRTGYSIGLGYESGSPLGLGIEGLYSQQGVTSSTPGDSRELNYIDVPVYLRLSAPTPGLTPFAYAGPQASFEMACNAGGTTCPNTGRPKTTYAGVIGAGIRLMGGLTVEGRYVYGLTDLKLATVQSTDSYKTRSFMVLVGFGF